MRVWAVMALGLWLGGCKKQEPVPAPAPIPATPAPSASSTEREWTMPTVRSEERDEAPDAPSVDGGAFQSGALSQIGPAGPASASEFGVVMITKNDDVVLAPPGKAKDSFKGITLVATSFNEKARGPAIAGEFAYFVSKGRLVRRRIKELGPAAGLVDGARDGTRIAVLPATDKRPTSIVYIANPEKPDGSAVAMLWTEGNDAVRLSPEGTGASSVAMTEVGDDVMIAILDGRTGMTPVHARRVSFKDKKPSLGENTVVWVAGPAQVTTELVLAPTPNDAWIFVPLERETTSFGLAQVHIGQNPKMGSPVEWRAFPNGLDPAPLTTVRACGKDLVLYTRPQKEQPGSPEELDLAVLGDGGLESPDVLARSKTITNVSAIAMKESLLVVYVGDEHTWALTSPCPTAKKK